MGAVGLQTYIWNNNIKSTLLLLGFLPKMAALVEAVACEWDSGRIAAHASNFRWDDNVARLSGILQTAAHPLCIDSAA